MKSHTMLGNSGDDRLLLVVILAKSLFKIKIFHDVDEIFFKFFFKGILIRKGH